MEVLHFTSNSPYYDFHNNVYRMEQRKTKVTKTLLSTEVRVARKSVNSFSFSFS